MSIGLFIDGAYVWKVFRQRIDYLKLRQHIEAELKDEVDEGYFFDADDDPPKAQKLHNALAYPPPKGPGLRVKIYWLQRKQLWWPAQLGGKPVLHPDNEEIQYELKEQKAVDVGLAFHLTRSFSKRKWTKLALAAGDADFHEPVRYLVENENVDLYLIGSMSTISDQLRPYARKVLEIDKEPLHNQLRLFTMANETNASPDGETNPSPQELRKLLQDAFQMAVRSDGWAYLSDFGNKLHEIDSKFDPHNYGHEKLSGIIKDSSMFELSQDGKIKML